MLVDTGWWCWDCDLPGDFDSTTRIASCHKCGQERTAGSQAYSPVARELGIDKKAPLKLRGLDGCSGFYWQGGEDGLGRKLYDIKIALKKRKWVKNELGDKISIQEFWNMFKQIAIEEVFEREFS